MRNPIFGMTGVHFFKSPHHARETLDYEFTHQGRSVPFGITRTDRQREHNSERLWRADCRCEAREARLDAHLVTCMKKTGTSKDRLALLPP